MEEKLIFIIHLYEFHIEFLFSFSIFYLETTVTISFVYLYVL